MKFVKETQVDALAIAMAGLGVGLGVAGLTHKLTTEGVKQIIICADEPKRHNKKALAKGTPIASITGAPELLSALTDITSFASGRAEIYTLVLLFYTGVVALVVWGCERVRRRLQRVGAT